MLQPPRKLQAPRTHTAPRRAKASKVTGALRWVGSALAMVILCISLFAAAVLIVIPFATGSQTYTVLTGSMAPGYSQGTLIVVKPHDFNDLTTGDVVTYQLESGQNTVVTHRIVGFTADQEGDRLLITQGDANNAVDRDPVMEIQVRGKLFYAVPYAGYLANALGHSDRGHLVELIAVGLILYGAISAGRGLVSKRREPTSSPEPIKEATE